MPLAERTTIFFDSLLMSNEPSVIVISSTDLFSASTSYSKKVQRIISSTFSKALADPTHDKVSFSIFVLLPSYMQQIFSSTKCFYTFHLFLMKWSWLFSKVESSPHLLNFRKVNISMFVTYITRLMHIISVIGSTISWRTLCTIRCTGKPKTS